MMGSDFDIRLLPEEERRAITERVVRAVDLGEPWDWFLGRDGAEHPVGALQGRSISEQKQILKRIALGATDQEIAIEFNCAPRDVRILRQKKPEMLHRVRRELRQEGYEVVYEKDRCSDD